MAGRAAWDTRSYRPDSLLVKAKIEKWVSLVLLPKSRKIKAFCKETDVSPDLSPTDAATPWPADLLCELETEALGATLSSLIIPSDNSMDALRNGNAAPDIERFAPAWSELLSRAVEEPGLICEAYSRFHDYSLGNRFAALLQCEMRGLEPGPLNSFNGWRKLGYGVQEGQKALVLCMPLKGTLHREKRGRKVRGRRQWLYI